MMVPSWVRSRRSMVNCASSISLAMPKSSSLTLSLLANRS